MDRKRYSFNTVYLVEGKLMTMSRNLVVPKSSIHIMKPRKKEGGKQTKNPLTSRSSLEYACSQL
jgi:hypothetical protein